MQKQSSLLNFFQKPPANSNQTQPNVNSKNNSLTKVFHSQNLPHNSLQNEDTVVNSSLRSSVKKKVGDLKEEEVEIGSKTKKVKRNSQTPSKSKRKNSQSNKEKVVQENEIDIDQSFDDEFLDEDEIIDDSTNLKENNQIGRRVWVSKRRGRVLTREAKPEIEDVWVDVQKQEGKEFSYYDFYDPTPVWARKENAKDEAGRTPDDPEYDSSTLYIPPDALKDMTPAIRQYWQIKSKNYDKILMFKVGKFFEIYYDDALICHKEIGLRWRGSRMECNFPDLSLEKFAYQLVKKGYKVCVVEQTETPRQMEARVKAQKRGPKERLVKREPVQILSRGTYVDYKDPAYESKVLLSFRHKGKLIGVSFLDIGSNLLSLGFFQDDENLTSFKMFVSQVRPVEVVYEPVDTDSTLLKIIKNNPNSPTFSPISKAQNWSTLYAYNNLEKYCGGSREQWPDALKHIMNLDSAFRDLIIESLSGMMQYLTKMLILENVFQTARYQVYDLENFKSSRMILDSQALQHLEILEVGYMSGTSSEKGSLLSYLDHTTSHFGKRLLKKWICAPLMEVDAINDRLDAIEDLNNAYEITDKFRKELKNLPDLERMCGRIYNLSTKGNENVFLVEDIGDSRLKEFKKLLEGLKKARSVINMFKNVDLKSKLLKQLTTLDDYESFLNNKTHNTPDIFPVLKLVSDYVGWVGPNQDKPVPKTGIQEEYDIAKSKLDIIEAELQEHLKEIQKQFRSRDICFAHTKHRYEVEIPSALVAHQRPDGFEFSSRKQGKERFLTQKIKDLVPKLEEAEEEVRRNLNLFVWTLFKKFHGYYRIWDRFVDALSQLDCLCSLSLTSFKSDGVMCRPDVYLPTSNPFLEVRDMRHPCISLIKANFISNDIVVGDPEEDDKNRYIILLTGPNMGGKSTILRQVCIAVILAQIGCYVPASSCRFSIVDRIFTRIGASDNLMEGKSTFFIEMEETLNVLRYGTSNSLVIMDELGRGTSTFDGVSIAYSVLNYLVSELKSRTFFATHYHVLLEEFRDNKNIAFFHMAFKLDEKEEKIIFLYKLKEGGSLKSFGLNIARLSGLPENVILEAKRVAEEFEQHLNLQEYVKNEKAFNKIISNIHNKELEDTENIQNTLNNLQFIVDDLQKER